METNALYKNFFGRNPSKDDFEIVKSEGSFILDSNGKQYIDFLMGWCVGNFGWDNLEIKNAMSNDTPDYVYPNLLYRPWGELAKLLASITPGKLKKSFRTTGGTESVDAAMQIAMCYTNRHKFMSIEGSYHGNSLAAISIGSSINRNTYQNLLSNCYKVEPPLDKSAIIKIENRLKRKDIAAFIMEPIICNMGVLVPEQEFMTDLQKLCKKYGTLLIMDEVATGFGRTGKLFATEHFEIEPDIMTLAKAITGGYASLGAVITTEEVAKSINKKIGKTPSLYSTFLYSTFGWHPSSVNAAIASINYIIKSEKTLLKNVSEMSHLFQVRLQQMKFKKMSSINLKGLAICVNTGDLKYAKQIKNKCKKSGLLIDADGPNLMIFPALTIDKKTAEDGLNILENCL
jgi:adenosylmethionine-8-amino-7-oxononanoate aminotransferase